MADDPYQEEGIFCVLPVSVSRRRTVTCDSVEQPAQIIAVCPSEAIESTRVSGGRFTMWTTAPVAAL